MRLTEFLHETRSEDVNDISLMEQRLIEDRNIINADELSDWANVEAGDVALRLASREDSLRTTLHQWLSKALRKYILTTTKGSKVTTDPEGTVYAAGGLNTDVSKLPAWAKQALELGKELIYINPGMRTIGQDIPKDLRLVRDWLKYKIQTTPEQLTPNRLSRLSFQNALSLSDDYHEELARKRPASEDEVGMWYTMNLQGKEDWAQLPWHALQKDDKAVAEVNEIFTKATGRNVTGVHDPVEDHVLVKDYGNGNKWVKLTTQECLNYEGNRMGHCVAGYGHDVSSGYVDIISFRDGKNNPHITVEIANESVTVSQIKGKENEPPVAKYIPYVIDLLNDLYKERGVLKYADEAELDLTKMGMLEDESTNTIKMVTPPFESSSFGYNIKYKVLKPEGEEEDSWGTTSEGTSNLMGAIEGTLDDYESMSDIQSNDIEHVLNEIIKNGKWQHEDTDGELGILRTIWYDGPNKDVKREFKQVVPAA